MARSTSKDVQSDVDDMFGTTAGGVGEDDFADVDDLLDEVEEDDSEGWVPKEKGEGIAGRLIKIGETRSDFAKSGEDPMCPTWTIQTKDGDKFRVIGFGAVLKREMTDAKIPDGTPVAVGHFVAVKYFGEKIMKRGPYAGKTYKHFGVAARR